MILLLGCTSPSKRHAAAPKSTPTRVERGSAIAPKPLAIPEKPISPARLPKDDLDQALLIPPPPKLDEMTQRASDIKEPDTGFALARNEEPIKKPSASADESLDTIRGLHQRATAAYALIDSFEARLTRRETINGKANPQEVIFFQFRKKPFSVHLKWLGTEGKGREVLYVQGQHNSKMHVKPSKEDAAPLPPIRMAFNPDDSMIRSKTRHDIREAGLGEAIRGLGNMLDMIARDPSQRSRLRYLGQVTRPESVAKMDAIEETIPPKVEPLLPQGGKRFCFFENSANSKGLGLPLLVITYDSTNKEVEYYNFDNLMTDIKLSDADFDPDKVWSKR